MHNDKFLTSFWSNNSVVTYQSADRHQLFCSVTSGAFVYFPLSFIIPFISSIYKYLVSIVFFWPVDMNTCLTCSQPISEYELELACFLCKGHVHPIQRCSGISATILRSGQAHLTNFGHIAYRCTQCIINPPNASSGTDLANWPWA